VTAKHHTLERGLQFALGVLLAAIALVVLTVHSSSPSTDAVAAPRAGAPKTASPSVVANSNSNADHISTTTIAGLGAVLVSGDGATLYTYAPDHDKRVTCVRACAAIFPPMTLARDVTPVADRSAHHSLLGSEPDPAGGRIVTYAGWPLYTYTSHSTPGTAPGQGLNINGGFLPASAVPSAGLWHVIAPSGKVIANKR